MEWATNQGSMAMTNKTQVDWFSDIIYHNHGKPSNGPIKPSYAIG
jgi:hypothetical protein